MAIEKMSLVEVTGDISKLDEVLFRSLILGNFQPQEASMVADHAGGFLPIVEENPYTPLLNQARQLGAILGMGGEEETPKQARERAKCISQYNKKIKDALVHLNPQGEVLSKELEKVRGRISGMKRNEWVYMGLSYRLSTARMKAWTGTVEAAELPKTKNWDSRAMLCCEVLRQGETVWVAVFADTAFLEEAQRLLIGVNFREVPIIPPEEEQDAENGLPKGVNDRIADLARKQQQLLLHLEENKDRMQQIQDQAGQQLGIDNIYTCKYLKFRFGLLPEEQYQLLEQGRAGPGEDVPFLFSAICKEGDYRWGVYLTTDNHIRAVDEYFRSVGFDRIWMPQMTNEKTQHRLSDWSCFLNEFQEEMARLTDRRKELIAKIEQNENAMIHLKHVEQLDVSFDNLFSCQYLKIRFGRLPADSYEKLDYYADKPFIFNAFDRDGQYYWGVYFTTPDHAAEIDDIFASLYFERVKIPDFAHGTPDSAERDITRYLEEARAELKKVELQIVQCTNQHREQFYRIYAMSKYLSDSFGVRKYVGRAGNTFRIMGFVPVEGVKQFEESISAVEEIKVAVMPPDSDKRLKIPTKLKNSRFAKPFEMFVDMYGMPSYRDIDPTPILAVTYTLLFGIMFGDLGQGLAIALLGWFLSKKNGAPFGKILTRIGLSSAVFGFAYGSVFGLEHALDPVFHLMGFAEKPIEVMDGSTINTVLMVAIGLGVFLILLSMITNIILGLRQKDYERAVFGNNGIAGLVFYLSVVVAMAAQFLMGVSLFTAPYILFLIVLPLLVVFLKEPLAKMAAKKKAAPEDGIGSFLMEGFFELFEVVLSFLSNTMSFLRVGGFIISHAGMMTVVMTLSEMVGGSGSVLVLIFGNLFVMALEGFIVGIQCLRLEFYEMFSRYFEGDGDAFVPVGAGRD